MEKTSNAQPASANATARQAFNAQRSIKITEILVSYIRVHSCRFVVRILFSIFTDALAQLD